MKVLLVAGGTGGHVYPALALASYIESENGRNKVVFAGSNARIESTLVKAHHYKFVGFDVYPVQGGIQGRIKGALSLIKTYNQAKKYLKTNKFDLVVGFGGYITYPILKAANDLKIKTIIHEQNSIAGAANLKLANKAAAIITCYQRTAYDFGRDEKVKYLGNPRSSFVLSSVTKPCEIEIDKQLKTVLIVMGSQGSSTVNDVIVEGLNALDKKAYQVIFVTGEKHYQSMMNKIDTTISHVIIQPYIEDMPNMLKHVDVVVSRAGATTIAELLALGIPSILIPSPFVPNNHQEFNAKEVVSSGAGKMILEADLTAELLVQTLDLIVPNDELLQKMKASANDMASTDASQSIYKLMNAVIKS